MILFKLSPACDCSTSRRLRVKRLPSQKQEPKGVKATLLHGGGGQLFPVCTDLAVWCLKMEEWEEVCVRTSARSHLPWQNTETH